ncbi:site-specific DNA-methyltransferase [Macrococcoides goetzii]|nr:site-specific DNA-methyltransferase [Macrococcus goetzii]TDM41541.1 site-specific DNA-methyltransferase [Macrococcus goetzii]
MNTKINEAINEILNQFGDKYIINSQINKSKVLMDLENYDKGLLEKLLSNEIIKNNFSLSIEGNTIIQINKLKEVFEADEYWQDSFTKYSKKIGLTTNGRFLDEETDVVLDFPYKDTLLKASMSREDTDQDDLRPNEPFLNEIIAKEEIDVLLDQKILINAKKYDSNGFRDIDVFDGSDNLIIKGNNLLALHTLKDKYAGKVELIYIDPPYNTYNDSFNYNDKFNHSTWLTFMKNRLEVAYDLLSDTGSIWINLDLTESHYLKVLCDNIFGRDKFYSEIIWVNNKQSKGYTDKISLHHNSILVYSKSEKFNVNLLNRTEEDNINYKNPDNDPNGPWRASDVRNSLWRPNLQYDIHTPSGKKINHPENGWRFSKETFEKELKVGKIKFNEDETRLIRKIYLKDQEGRVIESVWNTKEVGTTREANSEIKAMFNDNLFATPKPEKLLQRIIHVASKENEVILDFFMGSGTTQAVAHKMNRQYIGIEQMDYINSVAVPRLQKVIEGEQGGVSKEVNWQGGGSFIYVELMEKNRGFLKAIENSETQAELFKVFEFMINEADIDFKIDLENVKNTMHELTFLEQKKLLIKIIDKNQLYYNYSEINDGNVRDLISENDYEFNNHFYEKCGEDL